MSTTWDREPLWRAVRTILDEGGTCTAAAITSQLQAAGWAPTMVKYNLTGRVYQLLREKMVCGEVVVTTTPGCRAKGYSLAQGLPSMVIYFTAQEYATLHRIARKLHITPINAANRIMQAGIEYMQEVLL